MRVTRQVLDRQSLRSIHKKMDELSELNRQISTGRRIGTVSDDVQASGQLLALKRRKASVETFSRNLDLTEGALSTALASLENTTDVLSRARELGTQAATGTFSDSNLRGMAQEVNGILEQVVSNANAEYAGENVFSGERSGQPPYAVVRDAEGKISDVSYQGGRVTTKVPIAPGRKMRRNFVGANVFGRNADTFQTLIQLRDAMETGDKAGVRDLLDELKSSQDGVNTVSSELGSDLNTAKMTRNSLQALGGRTEESIAGLADTDIAVASTEYRRTIVALEAVMKLASESMPSSFLSML